MPLPSTLEPNRCLLLSLALGTALVPLSAPEVAGSFSVSLRLEYATPAWFLV